MESKPYTYVFQIATTMGIAYMFIAEGVFEHNINPTTLIVLLFSVWVLFNYNPVWKDLINKWTNKDDGDD
ncbi:hypothetical protein [Bacillus pseudomycoides]|uniref:hypothetical protein n=1 Tax=Bacillus pseudomycoides TaxID=64104 RepID=UPI000BED0D75|nr:hypothetical protein [Bacillus pseudomycoides]PDY48734.1 hypothetical protein CON79_02890 [Bacillus pseudomycoides]PED06497.1 hypothetical protein COO19_20590 [Bacillus pseudomycoides]PED70601.1 hypothetical protein CON97_18570 [Bacillus pseudomycoides]PEI43032.1 hypothetical protein CN620_08000 [Bacillus pseudomycoides]PEI86380.1 hypothetical protein CN686_27960 [Bacillus pseudomycoides]